MKPCREKPKEPEFWITNISTNNISLSDLNITLNSYTSVNLLDKRHQYLTIEEIRNSLNRGALSKYIKMRKIVIRHNAPVIFKNEIKVDKNAIIPNRHTSIFEIEYRNYEELDITDEEFAAENAETAEIDTLPLFKKEED